MQTNNSLLFISVKFFSNNDEKQHLTDNLEAASGIIVGIGKDLGNLQRYGETEFFIRCLLFALY